MPVARLRSGERFGLSRVEAGEKARRLAIRHQGIFDLPLAPFWAHTIRARNDGRSMVGKHSAETNRRKLRSKITNGTGLLPSVDHRLAWPRRFKDLVHLIASDIAGGNHSVLSQGQMQLIRRAAALTVELGRMEGRVAENGGAEPNELEAYQRASNTLRRLIAGLGISRGRIAKDVTPDLQSYLRTIGDAAE